MRSKRGFTLLEMLVASSIMAVAVVGLMSTLSGSARNAARLRDYDRVVQLARLKMNDLLADPRSQGGEGQFPPELVGGLAAGWRAAVGIAETGPDTNPGNDVLDGVRLEVWWMGGDQRRTFTLEGYRHRIIR